MTAVDDKDTASVISSTASSSGSNDDTVTSDIFEMYQELIDDCRPFYNTLFPLPARSDQQKTSALTSPSPSSLVLHPRLEDALAGDRQQIATDDMI